MKHRTRDNDPVGYQYRLRRNNPSRYLWRGARSRARRNGLEFTITPEDVIIPSTCPIFGISLTISDGRHKDNSPSLDRCDNRRGYTPDNILVISWKANRIKGSASIKDLRRLVDYYEQKGRKSTSAKNKESTDKAVRREVV